MRTALITVILPKPRRPNAVQLQPHIQQKINLRQRPNSNNDLIVGNFSLSSSDNQANRGGINSFNLAAVKDSLRPRLCRAGVPPV